MHPLESHEVVDVAGGWSLTPLPLHGSVALPPGDIDRHAIGLPRLPPAPSPL